MCARLYFCVCSQDRDGAINGNESRETEGDKKKRWRVGGESVITQTCLHSKYVMKSCW